MAGASSYAAATARASCAVVRFGGSRRVSRTRLRRRQNAAGGGGRFGLDYNSELQVAVKPSSGGSSAAVEIELVATNGGGSLALHWGALQPGRSEWVVPPGGMRLPEGTTRMHDDDALRTAFKTSGSNSTLKIEIDDPGLESIEFVVVDEAQNKWFKNNGIVPGGSTLLEMACESSFSDAESDGLHYQVLEIELDEDSYMGMPFVLRSNQTWMKNGTSDF